MLNLGSRISGIVLLVLLLPILILPSGAVPEQESILPPSQSVAPAIVTADSGPKPSRTTAKWSRWYRLGVGKAPTGYTVQKVDFWMTGDNRCGASAECRELKRTDDQVVWEFRMHGHEEESPTLTGYAEAHIRVIYRAQSTFKR